MQIKVSVEHGRKLIVLLSMLMQMLPDRSNAELKNQSVLMMLIMMSTLHFPQACKLTNSQILPCPYPPLQGD